MAKYSYQKKRFHPCIWNGLQAGRGHGLYFKSDSPDRLIAFREIVALMQRIGMPHKISFRDKGKEQYYRIYVPDRIYQKTPDAIKNRIMEINLQHLKDW